MALSIKALIEKNKSAHKQHFYIESLHWSHLLIVKSLRQVIVQEKIGNVSIKPRLSDCVKILKKEYKKNPLFKRKLKKELFNSISDFNTSYKLISKELKFQYPEVKLKGTSKHGLEILASLNASMIKLHSNRIKI